MDEDLARLRRAWAETPSDEMAARAYDSALLRASRREEVEERIRAKFLCSGKWIFALTREERYCWECRQPVFLAHDEREVIEALRAGRAAAAYPSVVKRVIGRLVSHPVLHTAQDARAARVAAIVEDVETSGPDWQWFLYKASWGSEKAPLILSDLERRATEGEDGRRLEGFIVASRLPDPPPVLGPPHRLRAYYDELFRRGASVDRAELMHDALAPCRAHWSMDEYCRLSRGVDEDWENYNSQDVVAAMILLVTALAEINRL